MLSRSRQDEIRNALWGCVEIPLYLKRGATRFTGTVSAFKHSLIIPILLVPIIITTVPAQQLYADQSFLWIACLYVMQVFLGTAFFMLAVYLFKSKDVTNEHYLRCIVGYNWLGLSAYCVNIPLILLGHLGVHPWGDIYSMMMLVSLYSYSYLAYMITYTLKTNAFIGMTLAVLDLLLSEVIRNVTTYFMMHHF